MEFRYPPPPHGSHYGMDVSAANLSPASPGYSDISSATEGHYSGTAGQKTQHHGISNKVDAATFKSSMVSGNAMVTSSYLPALQQDSNPVTPDTNRNARSDVCQASGFFQLRASAVLKEAGHKKPIVTNFVLIVDVLLDTEMGMMAIHDICSVISEKKYPYYKNSDKWKGGIKYTLSVNDCFYMIPRADGKRGCLWAIHQADRIYICFTISRKWTTTEGRPTGMFNIGTRQTMLN